MCPPRPRPRPPRSSPRPAMARTSRRPTTGLPRSRRTARTSTTWASRKPTAPSSRPRTTDRSLVAREALGEALEHALIFECRGVAARGRAGRDLAQEAPHDLARPRLGQRLGEPDLLGPRERADLGRDVLAQLGGERV